MLSNASSHDSLTVYAQVTPLTGGEILAVDTFAGAVLARLRVSITDALTAVGEVVHSSLALVARSAIDVALTQALPCHHLAQIVSRSSRVAVAH